MDDVNLFLSKRLIRQSIHQTLGRLAHPPISGDVFPHDGGSIITCASLSQVESTQRVYDLGISFVSARTNKRYHHHFQGPHLLLADGYLLQDFSLLYSQLFSVCENSCSRTQPHFWERTASVCIIHICSVFGGGPPPRGRGDGG